MQAVFPLLKTMRQQCSEIIIELFLYIISVVFLSYFGEKQQWIQFFICGAISISLYYLVQYRKYIPLYERIEYLETKEAEFAVKAEKYGIINFYNMQDEADKQERNIVNANIIKDGNFFGLLCETGNSYFNPELNRHWGQIKQKLERHDTVQLLLINPYCEAKIFRDTIGTKCSADIKRIKELMQLYPSLNIRFTNEVYCSVFFSEKEMLYDPYHLAKRDSVSENHLLALHFQKQDNGNSPCHYQLLKEHFNHLWNNGISLEELEFRKMN